MSIRWVPILLLCGLLGASSAAAGSQEQARPRNPKAAPSAAGRTQRPAPARAAVPRGGKRTESAPPARQGDRGRSAAPPVRSRSAPAPESVRAPSRADGDRQAVRTTGQRRRTDRPVTGRAVRRGNVWTGRAPYRTVVRGRRVTPGVYYTPYGFGTFGLGFYYYDPYYYDPFWWGGGYGYPSYGYGAGIYQAPYWEPTGSVRLKVKPREAQVFVDGYFAGQVDEYDGIFQSLKLLEGPHRLEIRADGYAPLTVDVRVLPGQKITYEGRLQPLP